MSILCDISVDNATIFRSRRSLQTSLLILLISRFQGKSGREMKTNPRNEMKVNIDEGEEEEDGRNCRKTKAAFEGYKR